MVCIIVRYNTNDESVGQVLAEGLPHFWAIWLIFSAKGRPISRADFDILLSSSSSSFPTTAKMLFAKCALRMFSATFIVKSTSTLSILGKALNHTPARTAFTLSFISSARLRKREEPICICNPYLFDYSILPLVGLKRLLVKRGNTAKVLLVEEKVVRGFLLFESNG